jgi:hypothetical protein
MRSTPGACSSSAHGINLVSSPLPWGEGDKRSGPGEGLQYWSLRLTTPFINPALCFHRHSRFVRLILQSRLSSRADEEPCAALLAGDWDVECILGLDADKGSPVVLSVVAAQHAFRDVWFQMVKLLHDDIKANI